MEVFKTKVVPAPRMLLKLHFIVCEEYLSPPWRQVLAHKGFRMCRYIALHSLPHSGLV